MGPTIPKILALAIASASLSAQDSRPGSGDEVRSYDVRPISATFASADASFRFNAPPAWFEAPPETLPCTMDAPERRDPGTDLAVDVLRFFFSRQGAPVASTHVALREAGWVQVIGSPAAHALVPEVIAEIARVSSQRIEVELALLPRGALGETSGTVLDATKATRLFSAIQPVPVVRTHVRPWSETTIEGITRRESLTGYRLAPASRPSTQAGPAGPRVPLGTRVSFRADPLPDGDFLVTVKGQQSELEEPVRSLLAMTKPEMIVDLPAVSFAATSASARLPSGSALVVGSDAAIPAAWIVRVTASTVPDPPAEATFRLIPLGAKAGPLHEAPGLAVIGPFLAVCGPPPLRAPSAEPARGRFEYELRVTTVLTGEPIAPLEEWSPTPGSRSSAGIGEEVLIMAGKSSTYLKDFDVEIGGQTATLTDPIFDHVFAGSSIALRAVRGGAGRAVVDARLEYHELAEMRSFATNLGDNTTVFEVPQLTSLNATVSADVALGAWKLIYSAPIGATSRQLLVALRVTD